VCFYEIVQISSKKPASVVKMLFRNISFDNDDFLCYNIFRLCKPKICRIVRGDNAFERILLIHG
jgi:hypothetical protein